MKEIDKVNLFIHFLTISSRFENQEEVGKFLGYPNKSSFSQMLKKDMSTVFRERFYAAFPEFEKFYIGFVDDGLGDKVNLNSDLKEECILQKETNDAIKKLQDRKIVVLTEKVEKFMQELEEFKSSIKN